MCIGPELMAGFQIAGLIIGAGGAATTYVGTQKGAAASKEAEQARNNAMELDAARQRREIIRRTQLAQATALTRTTSQTGSAATAGSSALPGSMGQESAFEGRALGNLSQQVEIGRDLFRANAAQADARSLTALGQGFSTIGSSLIKNSKGLSELGINLFGSNDPWNTTVRRA